MSPLQAERLSHHCTELLICHVSGAAIVQAHFIRPEDEHLVRSQSLNLARRHAVLVGRIKHRFFVILFSNMS